MTTEYRRMQQRRGTAAQWAANDEVVLAGELAIQTGPGTGEARAKIGDGITAFSALPWVFEVDAVARASIVASDAILVTLDSRVDALEAVLGSGGTLADLTATVAANTAAIAIRQTLLPTPTLAGNVLFWDGFGYDATDVSPYTGALWSWNAATQTYDLVPAGSAGNFLTVGTGGAPRWTGVAPGGGVTDAPTDGFPYVRADAGWERQTLTFALALSDATTEISIGDAKETWHLPYAYDPLDEVFVGLSTVSSSGEVEVDVEYWTGSAWASIFSTTVTVDAGDFTSIGATVPAVLDVTALAKGTMMRGNILAAGTGAMGAKIYFIGKGG